MVKNNIINTLKRFGKISLLAGTLIYSGCVPPEELPGNVYRAEQQKKQIELAEKVQEARAERRNGIYTYPAVFTNVNGSVDKYFPMGGVFYMHRASKDYCLNAANYQIFWINKKTGEQETFITNDPNNCKFHTYFHWDLKPNQEPFLELINLHDDEQRFFHWENTPKVYETHFHLDSSKNWQTVGNYSGGGYHPKHGPRGVRALIP